MAPRRERPHRRRTSTPISTPHEHKTLLRFITCGSVDDGKSTLIGRLLYDSKLIFEDQLAALEADSKKVGTQGGEHRLRAPGRRPRRRARAGHHHRRRLPVLRHRQAQVHRRRHARPRAVHPQHGHRRLDRRPRGHPDRRAQGRADPDPPPQLPRLAARHPPRRAGVNKMDLVDYSQEVFDAIVADYRAFAAEIGIERRHRHPVSALQGDNIIEPQRRTRPGTTGPTLIELPRDGRDRRRAAAASRSACRCSGSTARTSTSAASPA